MSLKSLLLLPLELLQFRVSLRRTGLVHFLCLQCNTNEDDDEEGMRNMIADLVLYISSAYESEGEKGVGVKMIGGASQ